MTRVVAIEGKSHPAAWLFVGSQDQSRKPCVGGERPERLASGETWFSGSHSQFFDEFDMPGPGLPLIIAARIHREIARRKWGVGGGRPGRRAIAPGCAVRALNTLDDSHDRHSPPVLLMKTAFPRTGQRARSADLSLAR